MKVAKTVSQIVLVVFSFFALGGAQHQAPDGTAEKRKNIGPADVKTQHEALRGMKNRKRHPGLSVIFDKRDEWILAQSDGIKASAVIQDKLPLFPNKYTELSVISEDQSGNGFVKMLLKEPVTIDKPYNSFDLWIGGDYFAWAAAWWPPKPHVNTFVIFEDHTGETFEVEAGKILWEFWGLLHVRFDEKSFTWTGGGNDDKKADYPLRFKGFTISDIPKNQRYTLTFDSMNFYDDNMELPEFKTNLDNPGFPTTPLTILPAIKTECVNTVQEKNGGKKSSGKIYLLKSSGGSDAIVYSYIPRSGGLADIEVTANDQSFGIADGSDMRFFFNGKEYDQSAIDIQLLSAEIHDDAVDTRWKASKDDVSVEYGIKVMIKGKSLVVDLESENAVVTKMDVGTVQGLNRGKMIIVPYISMGDNGGYVYVGYNDSIFVSEFFDWYVSNASELYGSPVDPEKNDNSALRINGGAIYKPLTDGSYNPVRERIFITVSSDFEEILPSIPNPKARNLDVLKKYMHTHWGSRSTDRMDKHTATMKRFKFLGIDHAAITLHEDIWSGASLSKTGQGPEEYTMTDQAPPDMPGGEQAIMNWVKTGKELGYYVGPYNNYTDYSPVGEAWKNKFATRLSDRRFQNAWAPCYNIKPRKAVDMQAYYSRKQVVKYGFNTDYNDVHTAVPPWFYVDYQAGIPGSGMFKTTFYSYGKLLRDDQEVFNGPVISEGGVHWMYAGLLDGSYGQIRNGTVKIGKQPLLVNFDLRKMHPLQSDVALGYGETLDGDRYKGLAYTIAYGHSGFLPTDPSGIWASQYYHILEQLQSRYVGVEADQILYGTMDGRLVDINEAITGDHLKNLRLYVCYVNGLEIYVNGDTSVEWEVTSGEQKFRLGKNSWVARQGSDFLTWSTFENGRRKTYVKSPEYLYVDPGGEPEDFGFAKTASNFVIKYDSPEKIRLIMLNQAEDSVRLTDIIPGNAKVKIYSDKMTLVSTSELKVKNGVAILDLPRKGRVYEISRTTGDAR
ncbi:MAG: hypothetical protein RBS73_00940 [Prolixibacteraceae bacterium]|nr:hypothetical protein [Prolixibacteraceae bacterium]